ncbi:MAG: hypothetical protein U9Q33_04545 [Campylobacterota bacterium]|nr:hypothetical protein [Campylobacterota bacterium]
MNWKHKVEHKFERLSDYVYDNSIKVLIGVGIVVVLFAMQMKHLTVDTSTEGFLHESDQLRIEYDKFKE